MRKTSKDSQKITNEKDNLPKGWVKTKIEYVCTSPQYGWTTSAQKEGKLHLLRTTDITSEHVNWNNVPYCKNEPDDILKYLLYDGDVVISRAGSVGFSYLVNKPVKSVFASYLIRFKPLINAKFFVNFLKSPFYWNEISDKTVGIALANVNATKLKQIPIPLPPLNEQKRIVSKLESIFTQIDAAKEKLLGLQSGIQSGQASLATLKSSVLKQAFEGKLVPQNPNDEPAEILLKKICKDPEVTFKNDNLPLGWVLTPVGKITSLINGRAFKPEDWTDEGLPIVRIQNLNDHSKPFNHCDFQVNDKFLINNGQLLFAWSGTPGTSFGCFIWNRGKAVLNQHIFKVKIDEKYLNKQFMCYAINQNLNKYINKAHGGVGLRHITKGKFEEETITLPPLNEQKRIVAKLESIFAKIDALDTHIKSTLQLLDVLKSSTLKRAFEGKLVPQNPNDEPADKLLEQIQRRRQSNVQ